MCVKECWKGCSGGGEIPGVTPVFGLGLGIVLVAFQRGRTQSESTTLQRASLK